MSKKHWSRRSPISQRSCARLSLADPLKCKALKFLCLRNTQLSSSVGQLLQLAEVFLRVLDLTFCFESSFLCGGAVNGRLLNLSFLWPLFVEPTRSFLAAEQAVFGVARRLHNAWMHSARLGPTTFLFLSKVPKHSLILVKSYRTTAPLQTLSQFVHFELLTAVRVLYRLEQPYWHPILVMRPKKDCCECLITITVIANRLIAMHFGYFKRFTSSQCKVIWPFSFNRSEAVFKNPATSVRWSKTIRSSHFTSANRTFKEQMARG